MDAHRGTYDLVTDVSRCGDASHFAGLLGLVARMAHPHEPEGARRHTHPRLERESTGAALGVLPGTGEKPSL